MNKKKKAKLEAAGYRVGDASEFLGLSAQETALVEMRLALSRALRVQRTKTHLTQTTLAAKMGSSQSRVAKMEAGDPTVSLDLLIEGLLVAGASAKDVGKALATV